MKLQLTLSVVCLVILSCSASDYKFKYTLNVTLSQPASQTNLAYVRIGLNDQRVSWDTMFRVRKGKQNLFQDEGLLHNTIGPVSAIHHLTLNWFVPRSPPESFVFIDSVVLNDNTGSQKFCPLNQSTKIMHDTYYTFNKC